MLDKWLQTIRICLSNHLAYKLNFIFMVIGPAVVFFFVKYNLWTAIYSTGDQLQIQGYDFQQMIEYQVWVLIVTLLAMGHSSMNMAMDIRMGQISKYLIYPFHFWQYHTASFLAFQMIQLGIAGLSLLIFAGAGLLTEISPIGLLAGSLYCCLVSLLWFLAQYTIGLIAFWLEETWVLRVMFIMAASFLSGGVIPLEVFPDKLAAALMWTPFPYMVFVPVKALMGSYEGSLLSASAVLIGWVFLFYLGSQRVWRSGMKMYTAAGM